jgi:hypothetical protein
MRVALLCLSLIITILLPVALSSARIGPESIVGLWLFDEGGGDTARDSSANGNDGTLTGAPEWSDGKYGQALDFDGSADYVAVDDSDSLNITGDITIMAWIYKRSDVIHGGTIVGKWKQLGDVWSYVLYGLGDGGGGFRLRWADDTQTNLEGPYSLPNNEWVHYAATYDGKEMKVFSNGDEIVEIAANKEIKVTANPVWIGNDGYQQHFNGLLDEVVILNVALTVDEINDAMAQSLSITLAVSPSGKRALTWGSIKADY